MPDAAAPAITKCLPEVVGLYHTALLAAKPLSSSEVSATAVPSSRVMPQIFGSSSVPEAGVPGGASAPSSSITYAVPATRSTANQSRSSATSTRARVLPPTDTVPVESTAAEWSPDITTLYSWAIPVASSDTVTITSVSPCSATSIWWPVVFSSASAGEMLTSNGGSAVFASAATVTWAPGRSIS